ncbi:Peptidoglycan-binding protein, CsiV [Fontimonas thermophila]|uniref:Peptidoglycan-binding protein, CsiV n=1 Tax=Fontimonas thermophila TaxID=1076937 RepID=A0A1I2KAA0_9GAMM|nr:CsiV family protein [Fontimonas thermophila]SFF62157.1 Peptidoglycan-binding protein, CsiV [Fontimonas thermophila]
MKRWIAKSLLVLLAASSLPAAADTYRVDLIVFLDKSATTEAGMAAQAPSTDNAIALDDRATLAAFGIRILPDSEFGLQEQWNRLRNAARFQPLVRLAWTQTDPPSERGPALQIRHGQSFAATDAQNLSSYLTAPVEGSVALLLNRYLQLDADLRYTVPTAQGLRVYRLQERRRMRRDELHHLDSPKLGILARVQRVEETRR